MCNPLGPTLAGFQSFITTVMGITSEQLPSDSPWIQGALNFALQEVNIELAWASGCGWPSGSNQTNVPLIYNAAVYNLAGSLLLQYAPDQEGQSFFATARKTWNILGFVPGVVLSGADVTTSESLVVPEFFKNLTLGDLQRLKDPFGRQYLAFAQNYGPTIWGRS